MIPETSYLVVTTWGENQRLDTHTRLLRSALRGAGSSSEIFAREVCGNADTPVVPASALTARAGPEDVIVARVTPDGWRDPIPGPPEAPLVLDCHGLFAPEGLEAWDARESRRMAATLDELERLRPRAALAVVDAPAVAELLAPRVRCPVSVEAALSEREVEVPADPRTLRRLRAQRGAQAGVTWVAAGGVHPLTGLEHAVQAVWAARRIFGLEVVLHVLGRIEHPEYARALHMVAEDLDVAGAVLFAGSVPPDQEAAYLQLADLLLDLSPSGRPPLRTRRALSSGTPVVASRSGTSAPLLDGAGLLVDAGSSATVAVAAHRLEGDPVVRRLLGSAAVERSAALEPLVAGSVWTELLSDIA